jgi:hypothetical protein
MRGGARRLPPLRPRATARSRNRTKRAESDASVGEQAMGDDERPDGGRWEVNEYRFETPLRLDLLFNPWMSVPPRALVAVLLLVPWLR